MKRKPRDFHLKPNFSVKDSLAPKEQEIMLPFKASEDIIEGKREIVITLPKNID